MLMRLMRLVKAFLSDCTQVQQWAVKALQDAEAR